MDDQRQRTCCFTGHRNIPFGKKIFLQARLEKTLEELIEQGYEYFGAGGALGFDTMAARTVLDLKERYPHVKLILVLPCPEQAKRWSTHDRAVYEDILSRADKTVYTSEHYTRFCMHVRNRHLVDGSSMCVAFLTEETGGTAYTVNYARTHGVPVINLGE